jgi:hypothetical protein
MFISCKGIKEGWYDGGSIAFAVFLVIVVTGMTLLLYLDIYLARNMYLPGTVEELIDANPIPIFVTCATHVYFIY